MPLTSLRRRRPSRVLARTLRLALMAGVAAATAATASRAVAQTVTTDPAAVRLEVGDLRRLASLVDGLGSADSAERAAVLERTYLGQASVGLRTYAQRYNVTGATLARALAAAPAAYADLNGLADAILAEEPALRAGFRRLVELHPGTVFPPIWFVAGHQGAGGMVQREGVIIAAERFASRPVDIVPIVLHELAHFQQAMVQGPDVYGRIYGPAGSLLALSLREGSAELVATLTTGRHINPAAERYGLANEAELWTRFQAEMGGRETGDWMFVRPANGIWPQDLGYWMGYRIARSYYDRATDKARAVQEILALTDFPGFLQRSGYTGGRR